MAPKPKVKPRRHGRRAVAQIDEPGVLTRRDQALTAFDLAFRRKIPADEATGQNPMSSGHYAQVEGDAFDGKEYPIADGRYRVQGSDWVHVFEGGGYVESSRAEAPHYGGKDVIAVHAVAPA